MLLGRTLLLSATVAKGYQLAVFPGDRSCACSRSADVQMVGQVVLEKKSKIVADVHQVMDDSNLMFCVRSEGLQVNELNELRQELPEGVVMKCVKNTLILRAAEEFPGKFQSDDLPSLTKRSNYWFFATEDTMRPAVEKWNDWIKEKKKQDKEIVGGVFGGATLDGAGVEAISKLPTKQELMGTTASLLKALPTKLARTLNEAGAVRIARGMQEARGTKMARAIKLASEKMP